jgi:hypothetical protein
MQGGEPMLDPVVAADGHTYERTGIERWLQNHNTSPVTREVMMHTHLTPNHQLKSQIEQWREEQKSGVARLKDLLAKMQWCSTSDEMVATLSALSEFVAETETLIPTAQLKRVRAFVLGDDELWSDAKCREVSLDEGSGG